MAASDWPCVRGDAARSASSSLPGAPGAPGAALPPPRPVLAWEAALDLAASFEDAGPAVAGGIVFVPGMDDLYALDLESGALLWKRRLGRLSAIAGPAVAEGLVLVALEGEDRVRVEALAARGGDRVWAFSGETGRHARSPVVSLGLVLVSMGDCLVALELGTGRPVWRAELPGAGFGAPPAVQGGIIVAGARESVALDLATGRELWRRPLSVSPRAIGAALGEGVAIVVEERGAEILRLADGERLWVHSEEAVHAVSGAALPPGRRVVLLADARGIRSHDLERGSIRWRAAAHDEVLGGPAVRGESVLFADGASTRAVELASGRESLALPAGARLATSPVVADGWLIACDEGDRIRAYRV